METIEGNKLIADFMFAKYLPTGKYILDNNARVDATEMKFHESWDWLMPVVCRIETLGFDVTIKGISCSVSRILEKETIIQLVLGERSMKINLVWAVVVEFIEWHNKQ